MIVDQHGRDLPTASTPRRRRISATYDAAQPGGPLQKHWSAVDWFSPNVGANPNVRRQLRSRSRYEVANNAYASGIVSTIANYVVGTGPRVRFIAPTGAGVRVTKLLKDLTARFNDWAWDIELPRKLHTMQRSKSTDGEGLGLMFTRNKVKRNQVALGLKTFESEMLTNPQDFTFFILDKPEGIDLGPDGLPETYHVLKHHPGGGLFVVYPVDAVKVPAAMITHWYDEQRPGLQRGLPEILPALPMFAMLRRYTAAVVTAAETAADMAAVMETNLPTSSGFPADIDAGDLIEYEKGQIVALPEGFTMKQLRAEHPGAQHETFIRCMVREIGRCLDMPYAVAAMDASGHNYSSMRGDWQAFFASIQQRRGNCEHQVLDKIVEAWMEEAKYLYPGVKELEDYDYAFDWPSWEPIDGLKDAEEAQMKLANRLTTYAREYGRKGLNWEDEFRQQAIEQELIEELGLTPSALLNPKTPDTNEDGKAPEGKT